MARHEGSSIGVKARGAGTQSAILALVATSLAIIVAVVLGGSGGGSCAPTPVSVMAPPVTRTPVHNAWVVGGEGTIRATTNGGATWKAPASGTSASLNDVAFSDATHGWAVGYDGSSGTIVATADGGATWKTQNAGTGAVLLGVDFGDASHGWAVGAYGAIIATGDGGITWTPQISPVSEWFEDVASSDATHAWAVGNYGMIVATADGGTSWQPQYSTTSEYLEAVSFSDATHGWAVGRNGTIVATADGGAHWAAQVSGSGADLWGVSFSDAAHGWAVGWDDNTGSVGGVILATTDGGTTWVTQGSGRGEWLYDVAFSDASHGWAVGLDVNATQSPGIILATTDGGSTWSAQQSGIPGSLFAVTAVRVFTRAALGAGDALMLTWENGMTTTVYDVKNPEAASQPINLQETPVTLASSYGVQPCAGYTVAMSLAFSGGAEIAIPAGALPGMGVAADRVSKLVAFSLAQDGAVTELPGRYSKTTKIATFTTESLSTVFALATDTKRPVAKALANATVKRGKKASLRYKITEGRPTAVTTITIRKGKKVVKTLQLKARATNQSLVYAFTCKLPAGTYTWTVKATDRLGNASKLAAACTKKLIVKP